MKFIRQAVVILPLLLMAVALTACGGHNHPGSSAAAASARAFASTPQFKHAEATAQARTATCIRTSHTPTSLIHCVAPKGTTAAVARCVATATAAQIMHPFRAAREALPRCVAAQEAK